jgi:hypothetical protein
MESLSLLDVDVQELPRQTLRGASLEDLPYLCVVASSTNITNYHVFPSKSTKRHIATFVSVVKVFVREHTTWLIGGVHNHSKKEVKYFKNYISCFGILATTKMQ